MSDTPEVVKPPNITSDPSVSRGTLGPGEPHPAFAEALTWFNDQTPEDIAVWTESLASCAIEGNRLGEVCCDTLDRIAKRQPISDRYFLGLVLTLKGLKAFTLNNTHEN